MPRWDRVALTYQWQWAGHSDIKALVAIVFLWKNYAQRVTEAYAGQGHLGHLYRGGGRYRGFDKWQLRWFVRRADTPMYDRWTLATQLDRWRSEIEKSAQWAVPPTEYEEAARRSVSRLRRRHVR